MAVIRRALRRLRRDESGLAFPEILASALVLAIGILPAVELLGDGNQTSVTAQNIEVVSEVGTRAMEEMRDFSYVQLKAGVVHQTGAFPTSGPVGGRVTGGTYVRPSGEGAEPLVSFSSSPGALPDVEDVTVGTGSGQRRVRIHRIVSWRTESCPLISIADLRATVHGMITRIETLVQSGGRFAELVGADGLGGTLSSVITSLLTSTAAKNAADATRATLRPVRSRLLELRTQLQSLRDRLDSPDTTGALAGGMLDLCKLPDDTVLPDLTDLNAALDTLVGTDNAAGQLKTVADATNGLLAGLLGFSADDVRLPDVTLAVQGGTGSGGPSIEADAEAGDVSLADLTSGQTTRTTAFINALTNASPRNTIRVTVAVELLDRVGDVGPRNPLWFSTVITNPKAHVL